MHFIIFYSIKLIGKDIRIEIILTESKSVQASVGNLSQWSWVNSRLGFVFTKLEKCQFV